MVRIETEDLATVETGTTLFSDVSVTVEPGTCVLLAGSDPDATVALGKALTGIIPRVERPDRYGGTVRHDGTPVADLSKTTFARQVGAVLANPATQIVELTVADELGFAPANLGIDRPEIDRRVTDALDRLGLDGLRDADPRDLSGGETRRVATAAALATAPDVALLCEPTFNVDPEGSRIIEEVITELCDRGTTVLLTETKLDAAANVADRALVLQDGRLTHDLGADAFLARQELLTDLGLVPPRIPAGGTRSSHSGKWDGPDAATDRPANLTVSDLRFGYGPEPVLRDVSLEVRPGETLALVGPNGSGKTTLAKQLNGLLTPERGTIRFRGTDITATPAADLASDIGYVFQNPDTQLFATTVREEVAYGPENIGVDDVQRRVTTALEAVGLADRAGDSIGQLSRGAKQRVTIASVLALEPAVVILDEPASGLDYRRFWEIMATITAEFQDAETSVVLVSHDDAIVDRWADRVVALEDGRILAPESTPHAAGGTDADVATGEPLVGSEGSG